MKCVQFEYPDLDEESCFPQLKCAFYVRKALDNVCSEGLLGLIEKMPVKCHVVPDAENRQTRL